MILPIFFPNNDVFFTIELTIRKKKRRPEFVLDSMKVESKLHTYDALKDQHLYGFFFNSNIRKTLVSVGLVNKKLFISPFALVNIKGCLFSSQNQSF